MELLALLPLMPSNKPSYFNVILRSIGTSFLIMIFLYSRKGCENHDRHYSLGGTTVKEAPTYAGDLVQSIYLMNCVSADTPVADYPASLSKFYSILKYVVPQEKDVLARGTETYVYYDIECGKDAYVATQTWFETDTMNVVTSIKTDSLLRALIVIYGSNDIAEQLENGLKLKGQQMTGSGQRLTGKKLAYVRQEYKKRWVESISQSVYRMDSLFDAFYGRHLSPEIIYRGNHLFD